MWTVESRARYDREGLHYPSDLTDTEWMEIAPLIPPSRPGGNKRTVNIRSVTNGLMYILSTGCQWRSHSALAAGCLFPPVAAFQDCGVLLVHFDKVGEGLDPEVRERHDPIVGVPIDPDDAVFGVHLVGDIKQPVHALAELPRGFTNSVLWPEFLELDRALRDHLQRVTTDMISQAVHADMRGADEVPNAQLG
jgi:hypothetical protein